MLDAIYRAAGLKTGLFTSPHLVHQGERIQVIRRILSHKAIVDYVRMLKPIAEELGRVAPADHPSFFEFMSGMAFLTFARSRWTWRCWRWAWAVNSTPQTLYSGTERHHVHRLRPYRDTGRNPGTDRPSQGRYHQGGRPVVIGRLPAEAEAEIRRVAALRNAPVHSVREVFGEDIVAYPETVLEGPHQRWNAATATLAARVAAEHLPVADHHISEGLATVQWAGRWDVRRVGQGKTLVFDAAHNEEGASALDNNLGKMLALKGASPSSSVARWGNGGHAQSSKWSRDTRNDRTHPSEPTPCQHLANP
jgi:dihydrofolate synthase/folylpolyglutamate synthase